MSKEKVPWEAISAHLKGSEDKKQLQIIEDWLKESGDHTRIYHEILNSWQMTRKETNFYEPDIDNLWDKLIRRIDKKPVRLVNQSVLYKFAVAAAVILIAFITGVWLGGHEWKETEEMVYASVISPSGSRTKMVLPDKSIVWLNSGAELRYPSSFENETRDVYVKGECFFDVAKDSKRQFIVHGNTLDVRVFGTSFNFRESRKHKHTEITLVEGKVQVVDKSNHPLTALNPGEQFFFNGKKGCVKELKNTTPYTAWKDNMIIFENEPLEVVFQTLESWYGVDFEVDSAILKNHNYTFKVKTESLREVLELISVITPIEYQIEGEQVNLKYK